MAILDQILQIGFFAAMIRLAVPLLLGTLGEMFSERAGILNLGIEGIITLSAIAGFLVAYQTGNLWLAVLASALVGMVLGLVTGVLVVTLGLDQTVAGLGMTITCTGLAYFIYKLVFGAGGTPPSIEPFKTIALPFLSDIPFVGPVLFDQYALSYLAFILVPLTAFYLRHTPGGLSLRTAGENPLTAASAGVSVAKTRYKALMISGALMGLAGAFLNLAVFNSFSLGLVAGRGWICLALVVLGRWRPLPCALAALLFGGVEALQLRLQSSGFIDIPYPVFLMMPFLITLIAMMMVSRRVHAPAALLKPFHKEER